MKAQIELFALTKFAMIFFIVGLSLILVSYGDREKSALCSSRAEFIAQGVGSALTQVINSPSEDERKIVPFETILSSGANEFAKYNISIFNRYPQKTTFIVSVYAYNIGCQGGASVGYPQEIAENVRYFSKTGTNVLLTGNDYMNFTPSATFSERSRYMILLKCKEKTLTGGVAKQHLFIEDCTAANPNDCALNFNDAFLNGIGSVCDFPDVT